MTRDDTKKIIMILTAAYPNYHPADLTLTVNTWHVLLEEYDYKAVESALHAFITTDTSGFAPSVGQLIDKMQTLVQADELTDMQAWSMVYKAICNSSYNAAGEFKSLPTVIRKAVGSAQMLKEWAMMDANEVNTVIQSNFIRTYHREVERQKEISKIPKRLRLAMQEKGLLDC